MKSKAKGYPNIIIHGFFGWGQDDELNWLMPYFGALSGVGNRGIAQYLTKQGYESYAPTLGPWCSAWDRSCELYAIIKGGTVDYGKVHSAKYHHARYGRTYPGLIPDWGKGKGHEKINIIGHSFGGPTVMVFSDLLDRGCQEEIDGTPADELSPLFKGGQAQLIHTATTLSGTNNGTTLASAARALHIANFVNYLLLGATTMIGESRAMKVYDMYMDHYGLSKDADTNTEYKMNTPLSKKALIQIYNDNEYDNIMAEMTVETMAKMNEQLGISEHIYYFARRACRSHKVLGTNAQLMDLKSFPIAHVGALITGWFNSPSLRKNYGVNADWYANDGAVNTVCTGAPFNKPQEEWTEETEIKPGIWYNMPVEYKDHFSWMGWLEDGDVYKKYYLDMVEGFAKLPDA